jgi:hypothetical protein
VCVCVCVILIVCNVEILTMRWPRPELGCYTTDKSVSVDELLKRFFQNVSFFRLILYLTPVIKLRVILLGLHLEDNIKMCIEAVCWRSMDCIYLV